MRRKKPVAPNARQPLYVVKLVSGDDSGYYHGKRPWRMIPKKEAQRLTHKEALRIRNYLRQPRIGYTTTIEPA